MGKAFSENEREEIRIKLLEAGVEMFHDNSVKDISIRELTRRAGISQGGFYTFYEDKDKFVLDVMRYRSDQKMKMIEGTFEKSLSDPAGFLSEAMFYYMIDMKHKTDSRRLYADVFRLFMKNPENARNGVQTVFRGFAERLSDYWKENKVMVDVDIDGVCNVMAGAFLLFYHSDMIERSYFDDIFRTYIYSNMIGYIKEE